MSWTMLGLRSVVTTPTGNREPGALAGARAMEAAIDGGP